MPTLLVWPEHDAFGSPEEGEALVATNPNFRLVRFAGAGHNPWFDDPETVVAEIERFLATEPRNGEQEAAQSPQRSRRPFEEPLIWEQGHGGLRSSRTGGFQRLLR